MLVFCNDTHICPVGSFWNQDKGRDVRSLHTSKKIVILGAGRRGLGLAKHLIEEHKDVVIIDNSHERVATAVAKLDCLGILG
ncbi:MAG TPA: hypothetical protein GXZ69_04975, partial [Spirochaetales bacterium]|nr:hypothetical protein [Spirochaetales bacterium]